MKKLDNAFLSTTFIIKSSKVLFLPRNQALISNKYFYSHLFIHIHSIYIYSLLCTTVFIYFIYIFHHKSSALRMCDIDKM